MLGARAAGYPAAPNNFDAQHLAHIRRVGAPIDFAHAFASPKQLPFDDRHVVTWARGRRNSWVVHNWKPVARWADIDRPEVRRRISLAARRLAALKHPVMLVIHHEPENDVTGHGHSGAGTAADYRHLWATVREAFDEAGATNVRWGMAYMNYPKWDSLVADLWPGDDLVDWLWFNAYGSAARPDIGANIGHFIDLADQHGIGGGKPWGIIEWGIADVKRQVAIDYFRAAAAFLDTDAADRLNAWMIFDSPGAHHQSGLRLGFDDHDQPFEAKLDAYRQFVQHRRFRCGHC